LISFDWIFEFRFSPFLEEEEEQLASAYPIVPLLLLFLSLLLSSGEYNLTSDAPRRDHPMVANMFIVFVSCDDFFEISQGVDE
jgi:hypothetical protein